MRRPRKNLRDDRSGTVAVTFGVATLPLIVLTGGAIDYANAVRKRAAIQSALDTGLIAAARTGQSQSSYVQAIVNANLAGERITISNATLTMATAPGGDIIYKGDASFSVQTYFLKIIGLQSVTVGAHSEVTMPARIITATFTPTNTQGAYSKDIFLWTKNAAGAVTSKQTVLTYRYRSSDGSMVTTPPIGTQSVTFSVPEYSTYGLGMIAYQDTTNYSGDLINPVETWSDAANASTFLQQSGKCAESAGATYNWEDGGDSNFVDFVYNMKCTTSASSSATVRLSK